MLDNPLLEELVQVFIYCLVLTLVVGVALDLLFYAAGKKLHKPYGDIYQRVSPFFYLSFATGVAMEGTYTVAPVEVRMGIAISVALMFLVISLVVCLADLSIEAYTRRKKEETLPIAAAGQGE